MNECDIINNDISLQINNTEILSNGNEHEVARSQIFLISNGFSKVFDNECA